MNRGYVRGLDGLRALAALMVFAAHQFWPGNWMLLGRLGVELFFVLSGYLIVGILTGRAHLIDSGASTRWEEIKRFFFHRAFRIFPPYYFMIAVIGLIGILIPVAGINLALFPAYITYTTNLVFAYGFHGWPQSQNLGHFWTLAIEEQFYLISAPLFLCFSARRHKAICAALLGTAVAMTGALAIMGQPWFTIGMDSLVNFGYLALGGLISQSARPAPGSGSQAIAAFAVACLIVALGCFFTRPTEGLEFATTVAYGLLSVGIVWNVVGNQKSRIVGWLEVGPLRAIGKISYAFYLVHILVKLPPTGIAFEGIDLIVVANLGVSLLIAQISWWLIEAPSLRLRDRLLRSSSRAAPVTSAQARQQI
jgi:peptidoglycan/LPS O-acetylase OafA/YrhL